MRVAHLYKKEELAVDSRCESFLLTQKQGTFFFGSWKESFSRYQGLHFPIQTSDGWDMVKSVHTCTLEKEPVKIESTLATTTCVYDDDARVTYAMLASGVLYITAQNSFDSLRLLCDCRGIYDFASNGRFYSFSEEEGCIILTYEKHTGNDEQSELGTFYDHPYRMYIVIKTTAKIEKKAHWMNQQYELEKKRNAGNGESYIFDALRFLCNGSETITLHASFNKEDSLAKVNEAFSEENTVSTAIEQAEAIETQGTLIQQQFAYRYAIKALDDLLVTVNDHQGIFAGLPWFYHFWTRDEAISLGGLLVQKKTPDVLRILLREITSVCSDGRISNRFPHSDLGSADGIGWACKRLYDFVQQNRKDLYSLISKEKLTQITAVLVASAKELETQYMHEGLIKNEALETWMDTGAPYDVRDGFRIEIQALYAIQLRLVCLLQTVLGQLTTEFDQREHDFRTTVAQRFGKTYILDGINADSTDDVTVRPNIFLAYYLYPWMFEETLWKTTFDAVIDACYVDWGGFATIQKTSPLYVSTYAGETNESYHRGDVWYWVNNLAAICLHKISPSKYNTIIDQITNASVKEILESGSVGRPAEVSSAKELESQGCYLQAWSAATFIELLHLRYA
ncbi:MAG: putative glycogen debranching enzyme [Candidatus Woesearchaeota archaeon]|jgi:predicted glycogen debranching enzyme